jgi:pyruvate formate lyase activating enzyme
MSAPDLSSVVPTIYWHQLKDGRVQCELCPRLCKLHEGQRGFCFVRARQQDQIVLTTYGRSSGFCVDPIEKKPLNHFLPGTPVLSFGTAGCNLACKFCQNWDISKSRQVDILADAAAPQTIAGAAADLGCASVAFTYNDPVIFFEYAIDVAQACHARGLKTVAVTAGYICADPRVEFFRHMDAANVDLKAFTESFYHDLTSAHLQPVLDTLMYLKHDTQVWLEITTLLIPGANDSDEELDAMTHWVVEHLGPDVPMHFSAFHPDWKMLDTPLRRRPP